MRSLIQFEIFKIYKRPRTYIAFGAVAALVLLIQFGLKMDGETYASFLMKDVRESINVEGNVLNGYLVCYIILQLLLVHVPLLVALIAADMISGEANLGTLRMVMCTPYSRARWMVAKFVAAAIYTVLLLVWLAFLALYLSTVIFGKDDLFLLKSSYVVLIGQDDVLWRYGGAFLFACLSLLTVASLGFFMSTFSDNSIGPIVITMSVIVFLTILSTLNIPLFMLVKPYLFTTHMNNWKEFFDMKLNANQESIRGSLLNPGRIVESVLVLVLHILMLLAGAIGIMKKKNILS